LSKCPQLSFADKVESVEIIEEVKEDGDNPEKEIIPILPDVERRKV
jgi:hypothetical protein